jgi:hypothetical protein
VLGEIKKIPPENITIIRGKNDNYFCDKENIEILKFNQIKFIQFEAGHDWNETIAKAAKGLINSQY